MDFAMALRRFLLPIYDGFATDVLCVCYGFTIVLPQNKAWEQKPSRSAKPKVGTLVLGFLPADQPDLA